MRFDREHRKLTKSHSLENVVSQYEHQSVLMQML